MSYFAAVLRRYFNKPSKGAGRFWRVAPSTNAEIRRWTKRPFGEYMGVHSNGALEKNTLETRAMHLRHLTQTLGSAFSLKQLKVIDLQSHITRRSKALGIRKRKLSAYTMRKEISSFRTIWNWAIQRGLLTASFPNQGRVSSRSWRCGRSPHLGGGSKSASRCAWTSNLGLVVVNTVIVRVVLPTGAVRMADIAHERGWGLFNNAELPGWAAVVLAVIALDLAIYLQHVMFHAIPILWRLHMVHHADLDFDVSTGLRFHTIEIILSMGIKLAAVVLLGAPALAVLLFEVFLNATSMFNHANARLPRWLDRLLRHFVVTPDMHRVHHSVVPQETNSNFGFNLPWWDFLFGTYREQPAAGHDAMTIGLSQFRDVAANSTCSRVLDMHFLL